MMKMLFLDFDGVLHPTTTTREKPLFCRTFLLQSALEGSTCDVVISSSWRHHYTHRELLAFLPLSVRTKVVGCTGGAYIGKWPRFNEIKSHLVHLGNIDWRALDDSFFEFPPSCPELIPCNPNDGIAELQVQVLKQWLAHRMI